MPEKVTPTSARFYLAEDIRTEIGGKSTLIGLFPNDRVTLRLEHLTDKSLTMIAFEGISILAAFDEAQGEFDVKVRLSGPDGKLLLPEQSASLVVEKPGLATFTARFRPFVTPMFGKHKYEMVLDGHPFHYEFEIVPEV